MARGTVVSSSRSGPADPRHEQAASRVPIRERENPISLRTIIWHSALEFLTFVLLFGVVTIGVFPGAGLLPYTAAQLVGWIVGLFISGAIALLGTTSGAARSGRRAGPY
jgi:glycerol uptake facilitator-like aquaporin